MGDGFGQVYVLPPVDIGDGSFASVDFQRPGNAWILHYPVRTFFSSPNFSQFIAVPGCSREQCEDLARLDLKLSLPVGPAFSQLDRDSAVVPRLIYDPVRGIRRGFSVHGQPEGEGMLLQLRFCPVLRISCQFFPDIKYRTECIVIGPCRDLYLAVCGSLLFFAHRPEWTFLLQNLKVFQALHFKYRFLACTQEEIPFRIRSKKPFLLWLPFPVCIAIQTVFSGAVRDLFSSAQNRSREAEFGVLYAVRYLAFILLYDFQKLHLSLTDLYRVACDGLLRTCLHRMGIERSIVISVLRRRRLICGIAMIRVL